MFSGVCCCAWPIAQITSNRNRAASRARHFAGAGPGYLERDVVVRAASDRHRIEIRGVGRQVRLGRTVRLCPVTGAEELHRVGNDIDGLTLGAILGLPFPPVQAPVDGNRAAFGEVLRTVLALRPEDRYVEVVGLVDPLTFRRLLTATRRPQTGVPPGVERSSGSRVRLPVIVTRLMFVAATCYPFPIRPDSLSTRSA